MPLHPEVARRLKLIQETIKSDPFVVFVWGPGQAGASLLYNKRRRIKDDLEEIVGKDLVFFSEDDSLAALQMTGKFAEEYAHVRAADAVVVLPESPGALVEAALYQFELNGKSIVFTTKHAEEAFARQAYSLLKVEYITPEEWDECDRVRRLAREYVEILMTHKYRQRKGRFDWEV